MARKTMMLKSLLCVADSWKKRQENIPGRKIHVFRIKAGEQGEFKELREALC